MQQEEASEHIKWLFETFGPHLFRYALRLTGSHELAEDLVQEAFLALYRELRNGRAIDNSKAWTLTVVRNQVRKHRRNTRRHAEDLEPGELLDCRPARVREADDPDSIDDLLADLSKREEEVLLLRLQSFRYREIAAHIGISAKSVATLLARALKKVKAARAERTRDQHQRVPVGVE